jgi:hypothetical protein|tara:strand:- start:2430 stop:2735 length:306 start_codon:yes stop_codon:yes gene_type:complete
MGTVKIFSGPPKSFDFNKDDLVIDNVSGDIYYKDWKGRIQKVVKSKDKNASLTIGSIEVSKQVLVKGNITSTHITSSGNISASGEFFASTGSFQIIEGGVF